MVIAGQLFGPRAWLVGFWVMLSGVGRFTLSSLLCGLAKSLETSRSTASARVHAVRWS
jgi:hypothetical protein